MMCNFRCRTLMLVGDDSPHIDDVVDMNGRMDPEETDFLKVFLSESISSVVAEWLVHWTCNQRLAT